jgi:hypothetical protein
MAVHLAIYSSWRRSQPVRTCSRSIPCTKPVVHSPPRITRDGRSRHPRFHTAWANKRHGAQKKARRLFAPESVCALRFRSLYRRCGTPRRGQSSRVPASPSLCSRSARCSAAIGARSSTTRSCTSRFAITRRSNARSLTGLPSRQRGCGQREGTISVIFN